MTSDVLVVEDPLFYINSSMITSFEPSWIHCSECFKQCLNLQPCTTCSLVLYCSQKCADEAWEKHHKITCAPAKKIFNKMSSKESNKVNGYDVLRVSNQALAMLAHFGVDNCVGALVNGQVSSDASAELGDFLNLHADQAMTELASSKGSSEAIEMVVESIDGLSDDKKDRLLEFLRRAVPIIHTYNEFIFNVVLERKKNKLIPSKMNVVGQGFYLRLMSTPRGCEANAQRCSYLKTLVIKALRPIEAGERIFFIHASSFTKYPKATRQVQYMDLYGPNFKCRCRVCSEDWRVLDKQPVIHNFIERNPKYKKSRLRKELVALTMAWETEELPLNWFTSEKLDLCNRILEFYLGKRRDDLQCHIVLELLTRHFPTTTKKHIEGDNTVASSGLDHCLVFKNMME
ncbi:uncharacterized protein LOC132201451 [Neocloeon triangulifer]|uniref:uncharacterized protein LOC132201451 n=1 Tax=Neocloeon triangulifer TaxID=2078957 RepID=UPI00286FA984|nr:uncharacterized protein LOC132201451 [Neocloeon triangulifer]